MRLPGNTSAVNGSSARMFKTKPCGRWEMKRIPPFFNALTSRVRDFAGAAYLLPSAIRRSLKPETEFEARNIEAQLELVFTNARLLDYALPSVGALLVFVHADRTPFEQMAMGLVGTLIACARQRDGPAAPLVERRRCHQESDEGTRVPFRGPLCSLMSAWGLFCLSLWVPPSSDIFPLFVLSCSLAAVTTMFSPHVAAVTGSFCSHFAFHNRARSDEQLWCAFTARRAGDRLYDADGRAVLCHPLAFQQGVAPGTGSRGADHESAAGP